MVRTSLFVNLDGGLVGVDTNDLSYQVLVANTDLQMLVFGLAHSFQATYKFVHGNTNHVLGHDDGTVVISTRWAPCDAATYPETEKTAPTCC